MYKVYDMHDFDVTYFPNEDLTLTMFGLWSHWSVVSIARPFRLFGLIIQNKNQLLLQYLASSLLALSKSKLVVDMKLNYS